MQTVGVVYQEARPLAAAFKACLAKLGMQPDLTSSSDEINASRQRSGDIEYDFAVNAAYDAVAGEKNSLKPLTATIGLPADTRPIYNALLGGPATEFAKSGTQLTAKIGFGPGQMHAYARTARPIGGVQVATPQITRDYTAQNAPLIVEIAATLVDTRQQTLAGSAPLQIKVIDPLQGVRYDLYRATKQGTCTVALPLAVNDPSGVWTVEVTDLLANTVGRATFTLTAPAQCGAVAGMPQRALSFGEDRQRIYALFQSHKDVTIAIGDADYLPAAAARLATILKPWDIRATIVKASEIKTRTLSDEEAATWVGHLGYAGKANIKPGANNSPAFVGFTVTGPVILLGSAQNNVLIKFLGDNGFLAYKTDAAFPGPGRALLSWQVEALRFNEESVAVVAADTAGMADGVGALYEAIAGLNPLTTWQQPTLATVQAATRNAGSLPALTPAWQLTVPDRPLWMDAANGELTICTGDGSLTTVSANGKKATHGTANAAQVLQNPKVSTDVKALPADKLRKDRVVKAVVPGTGVTAVAYWGGTLQTISAKGELLTDQQLPQDISVLAWSGNTLVVGLADGRVLGLHAK